MLWRRVPERAGPEKAFTLLDLLPVIAIIAVLSVLISLAASGAKSRAGATCCRSQQRQIGITMAVYLTDSRRFPPMWDADLNELWADKLYAPQRSTWTNIDWNCPTFVGRHGVIGFIDADNISLGYSYNWRGTSTGWSGRGKSPLPAPLGLGHLSRAEISEPEVSAPCEMYAVADVRGAISDSQVFGNPKMSLYRFSDRNEAPPPHEFGFNVLFADGHVALIKRAVYLYPPRSAHYWNRDNQPHSETWAPSTEWAVTP